MAGQRGDRKNFKETWRVRNIGCNQGGLGGKKRREDAKVEGSSRHRRQLGLHRQAT